MSERIVEGLWDCKYCQTQAIGGLTKHCPRCGHPQDSDTEFYLGTQIRYLEDDLAKQYGQGADWVCPFCESLNRVHFTYCANCAAPKDASKEDYFDLQDQKTSGAAAANKSPAGVKKTAKATQPQKKKRWALLGVLLLLAAVIAFVFAPRTYQADVVTTSWARVVEVEAYRTVQESDWAVPAGGRVYKQQTEFKQYVQVLDHYETRTRQVSERVYDGEDIHTSYSSNGDGTYTERTYSTPRYRTEWRTETYQHPVYRDEPVYATKYYYDIDKWVVDRQEIASGKDHEPYWPEYTLAGNERTGQQREAYLLFVQTKDAFYKTEIPYEVWAKYPAGESIKMTMSAGKVIRINGDKVESKNTQKVTEDEIK